MTTFVALRARAEQAQADREAARRALRFQLVKAALTGRATVGRHQDTPLADWAEKLAIQAVALADATLAEMDKTGGGQ